MVNKQIKKKQEENDNTKIKYMYIHSLLHHYWMIQEIRRSVFTFLNVLRHVNSREVWGWLGKIGLIWTVFYLRNLK